MSRFWLSISRGLRRPLHWQSQMEPPPHARLARWVPARPAGGDTRGLCLWVSIIFVLVAVPCLAADFRLMSPILKDKDKIANEQVFSGFGCTGGNVSPELQWQNAPKDTKSFAVTVYDPDAPTGSGWWHWVIFNIPSSVNKLPANAGKPESGLAPQGSVQSMTDFGQPGYGGPCPPVGDKPHRYIFTVYALKVDQLPLKAEASGAMVGFYLNQNALAKAKFTAYYGH